MYGGGGGSSLLAVILVATLSLWLSYNVVMSLRHAVLANAYNAEVYNLGYASSKFARSDVIHYIREAPIDGLVVSNASYALRVNTDLPKLADLPKSLDETREWVANAEDGTWIVWFYDHWNNRFLGYRAGDLWGTEGLEPIADLSEGVIWRVNSAYADIAAPYKQLSSGDPVISSDWEVYLVGRNLHYVRESCTEENTAPPFFLHVVPSDENDLPADRRQHGFDNLDFEFRDHGFIQDGLCAATTRSLPAYPIISVKTGQFTHEGRLWEGEVHLDEQ